MAAAAAAELRPLRGSFSADALIFADISPNGCKHALKPSEASVWLPTETQLHSIIEFEFRDDHPYFAFVRSAYHAAEAEMPFNLFSSFEQYALAFLMKSRHNKVWCKNAWMLI